MATAFATAARRLGLRVAGPRRVGPPARDYTRSSPASVAGARAQAVFLGGLLDTNAAAVDPRLRGALGRGVDLLGPDGLTPLSLLSAGPAPARVGVYVSLAGVVTERLPAAGAASRERFGARSRGVEVEPSAVYAAQATEVLLDAIARSDGTRGGRCSSSCSPRASKDGLLGPLRLRRERRHHRVAGHDLRVAKAARRTRSRASRAAAVERVVRPSPRLVAPES